MGNCADRRRLFGFGVKCDHVNHDDDGLAKLEPLFWFVLVDVVGLCKLLVANVVDVFGRDVDHDDIDFDHDGRPLRKARNVNHDDVDFHNDRGPVFLRVPDRVRDYRRRLHDDGMRARYARANRANVYLDDNVDNVDDMQLRNDDDFDNAGRVFDAVHVQGRSDRRRRLVVAKSFRHVFAALPLCEPNERSLLCDRVDPVRLHDNHDDKPARVFWRVYLLVVALVVVVVFNVERLQHVRGRVFLFCAVV